MTDTPDAAATGHETHGAVHRLVGEWQPADRDGDDDASATT